MLSPRAWINFEFKVLTDRNKQIEMFVKCDYIFIQVWYVQL